MELLFPNTGIVFIPLKYRVRTEVKAWKAKEPTFRAAEFMRVVENQWFPVRFETSDRDYARLLWKLERRQVGAEDAVVLQPILAVDTKLGEKRNGQLEKVTDAGHVFSSVSVEQLVPASSMVTDWFDYVTQSRNYQPDSAENGAGLFAQYRLFLDLILAELNEGSASNLVLTDPGFDLTRDGICGSFKLQAINDDSDEVGVSVYLDLGNSRSVAVLHEDKREDALSHSSLHPLSLRSFTIQKELLEPAFGREIEEGIFASRLEFRESPFYYCPPYNSDSFQWPSVCALGKEAQSLQAGFRSDQGKSGLSGPKRYLWDGNKAYESWKLSGMGQAGRSRDLQGTPLRYYRNDGKHQPDKLFEAGFDTPPTPRYPRQTLLSFFILEVLNQALIQVNSSAHRIGNLVEKRRTIRRLVLTYPTGTPAELRAEYRNQAQYAGLVFAKITGCATPGVHLGLDEASGAQVVFLQSMLNRYDGVLAPFDKTLLVSQSSEDCRIASIDIGGGTTDLTVASYNFSYFKQTSRLQGKQLFADGTSSGGDDVLKTIIEKFVLPSIIRAGFVTDKGVELLYDTSLRTTAFRTRFLSMVLQPIAFEVLRHLEHGLGDIEYANKTLLQVAQRARSPYPPDSLRSLSREGEIDMQVSAKKVHVATIEEVTEAIRDSNLIANIVSDYAKYIAKFYPSYVILSGKLSSLEVIREELQTRLMCPPDRVISLANFEPGGWFPSQFQEGGRIVDAKTSVAVGVAVCDVAVQQSNQAGFFVRIKDAEFANANYIGQITQQTLTFTEPLVSKYLQDGESVRYYPRSSDHLGKRNLNSAVLRVSPLCEVNLNGCKLDLDAWDTPPSCTLTQDPVDPCRLLFSDFEGQVIDSETGERVPLSSEHVSVRYKTMLDTSYFLDSGNLSRSRSAQDREGRT